MKYLILMWLIGLALSFCLFFIEIKLIPRLSEENGFKKWWRKHVVGVYNGTDF